MGVRSVSSQDLAALASTARRAPAPRSRTAEADKNTAPAARAGPGPREEQVRKAADTVERTAAPQRAGTRLHFDEASKRVIAQIVDGNNEVIKQIPPEALLRIAARLREVQGRMFDRKA